MFSSSCTMRSVCHAVGSSSRSSSPSMRVRLPAVDAIEPDVLAIEIQARQVVVVRILHPPDDARPSAGRRREPEPRRQRQIRRRAGRRASASEKPAWPASPRWARKPLVLLALDQPARGRTIACDVEGETGRRPAHCLGVERARAVRDAGRRRGRGERQGSKTGESRLADRHGRSRIVARRVGLHQFFTLLLPE